MEQIPSTKHELLDIVDRNGEPTGEQLPKSYIHDNGLWHRDVHVWVTNGTHVLQQQRSWDKTIMPGTWDISVAGHVLAGENYLAAAVRETHEELGLELLHNRFIAAGKLATEVVMEPAGWTHRIVGDNFVVVEPNLQIGDLQLQASEVIGARWYDIDQLERELLSPENTAGHAPQPPELWALGITAMRNAVA